MSRALVIALLVLSGCGYRLGEPSNLAGYRTISVPYARGDDEGRLTQAIVHEIARTGRFRYCDEGGELRLRVKITDHGRENIGYIFDTNPAGETIRRLVASEGRLIVTAEVCAIDARRCCTVLGPFCVKASIDYPFDPLSTDNELFQLSLGQYTPIDEAEDTARDPLYHELATKIVDYLTSSWGGCVA